MLFSSKKHYFSKTRLKKATIFCLPGFHFDPVWLKTQAELTEHSLSLVRQYLLASRADPYFGVYLSELGYLKPYLDLYPEERAWLKKLIQQERCTSGGAFNQPNETSIGGEALIRNILMGQLYHKTILECDTLIYMGWDAFGHIPQLPQILEQCGMRAAVITRTNYRDPSIPIPGIPDLFLWLAPNGSSIYTKRTDYYLPDDVKFEDEAISRFETQKEKLANINSDLYLDTADMHPPRINIIGRCRELANNELPIVTTGTAATKYFSTIETQYTNNKLKLEPVTRDMSQYNEGCELSRVELKIANRLAENTLFDAEVWAAIASAHGISYPSKELDKAWRQLLFCQHHDGITGCSTDIVFADLLESLREAHELAVNCRTNTLRQFSNLVDTTTEDKNHSLLLFNSLPWRRNSVIRYPIELNDSDYSYVLSGPDGSEIHYELEPLDNNAKKKTKKALAVWTEKDLPASGYRQVTFKKRKQKGFPWIKEDQSRHWLENEFIRVEVDPSRGGGIVSLIDKENGKEFINTKHTQPANDLMLLKEGPGDEPAWRLLTTGERSSGSESPAQVRCYEGRVTKRLIIQGTGPGPCNRIQEIRLYRGLPFIDCLTVLDDYKGYGEQVLDKNDPQNRDLYTLAFPLDLPGTLPVYEDRFYAKSYRRSQRYMDFYSTFREWKSKHAMNSCYRWIDVSWTFLVRFVSGKQEVSSLAIGPSEVVIAQDQHRSIRQRLMQHLSRHGITCTPRYDKENPSSDLLFRQCSFCIGNKEENTYTNHLLEQNPEAKAYYERNMEEIGYVVLALEDKQKQNFPVFIFAGQTNALTIQAVDEMILSTVAHRWECSSMACFIHNPGKVEDRGFALINRGNTLCSLENDGTLALALMHTTPYPSPLTEWMFDFAENKSHIFQYRLIPHTGDWRHAEIPRRAMEYNHEACSLCVDTHKGQLPSEMSFWSVEPGNILVSAIKPTGYPLSEFRSPQVDGTHATIRLYEAHGEESNIWLDTRNEVKTVKPVQINEKPSAIKKEIFREEQFIRTIAHANEIVTLNLNLKPPAEQVQSTDESDSNEPPPSQVRYWRLNQGAAPQGFLPVSMTLRGQIKTQSFHDQATIHHLDLILANNSNTQEYKGEAFILTPQYWRSIPQKVNYKLQPASYQIVPLNILFEGPEREGYVKVQTTIDGVLLEDIIHIGQEPELDISMVLTHESFNINLRHELPYDVSGYLSLISPIESWPAELTGEYSLSAMPLWKQFFSMKPKEEKILVFPVFEYINRFGITTDHHWMIIKLVIHHCVRYYHIRLDGKESFGLGRVLQPPYA